MKGTFPWASRKKGHSWDLHSALPSTSLIFCPHFSLSTRSINSSLQKPGVGFGPGIGQTGTYCWHSRGCQSMSLRWRLPGWPPSDRPYQTCSSVRPQLPHASHPADWCCSPGRGLRASTGKKKGGPPRELGVLFSEIQWCCLTEAQVQCCGEQRSRGSGGQVREFQP